MTDRVFGVAFLLLGMLGYLCIAEDFRQFSEIVGISAVFLAGVLLTVSGFHWMAVRTVLARSFAAGLLTGIPVGILLDNVPAGVALGLLCGGLVGYTTLRRRREQPPAPDTTPSSAEPRP